MTPPASATSSGSPLHVPELVIDELTLLIDIDPKKHQNLGSYAVEGAVKVYIELAAQLPEHPHLGLTRAYDPGCSRYKVSLEGRVPSANGVSWSEKTAFLIQAGPKASTLSTIRIDINPQGLTATGAKHVWTMLTDHLFVEEEWLEHTRVSRLDVAVDLDGIAIDDWVFDAPKRRLRKLFLGKEKVKTLYLGDQSASPIAVYNKARQLGLPADQERTRVEFRLKYPGLLRDLGTIKNALPSAAIYDPRRLHNYDEFARKAMLSIGQVYGLRGILSLFQKAVLSDLISSESTCSAPWWNPAGLWKDWNKVLHATIPDMMAAAKADYGYLAVGTKKPIANPCNQVHELGAAELH